MSGEGEFEYIRRRLAPLSEGARGAAGLTDDGAVISPPPGCELAVTADTLIEGRHFPVGETPALAARKALRVNLSDLAAMGADPLAYMSCVVWPDEGRDARADGFADGLATEQAEFGLPLIGGDTTSCDGPWMISITAFGAVPRGRAVRRSGARPGDLIVVTGTIGDAWLGLEAHAGRLDELSARRRSALLKRLRLPTPRIALSAAVRDHAHAAIDVSDGLLADLRHVAEASGVRLELALDQTPLSRHALAWRESQPDPLAAQLALASGGDDYELALCVSPGRLPALQAVCQAKDVPLTVVGAVAAGAGEVCVRWRGETVTPDRWGFTHF